MATPEIIAPCTSCGEIDALRPYGEGDALICFPCARAREERERAASSATVRSLASAAGAQLRRLD
jgi:hypothetical protein